MKSNDKRSEEEDGDTKKILIKIKTKNENIQKKLIEYLISFYYY